MDRLRGSASSRGYTAQWAKARAAFLRRNPVCRHCREQGRLTEASQVDHIKAHHGDQTLFWDERNWQALCASCHSRKTVAHDGGFYGRQARAATRAGAA